jgi:hypothetical protein
MDACKPGELKSRWLWKRMGHLVEMLPVLVFLLLQKKLATVSRISRRNGGETAKVHRSRT